MERYRSFGLVIQSAVPLPELERALVPADSEADAAIRRISPDAGPPFLAEGDGRVIEVSEGTVAFRVPQTAEFRISGGNLIEYRPVLGADEDKIRLYLLGTCMGALLQQRQILPLHGSAIEIEGRAYAIVGDSGAGKSTLTSVLLSRGFKLLTDDVAAVTFDDSGQPIVHPAYPQQKLWQESLAGLGMEHAGYRPLFERETKFAVPVEDRFCRAPRVLAGVFELVKTASPFVEADPINGLERLHTLYRHTFRRSLLEPLGLTAWHFETTARLSGLIRMARLCRPETGFTASVLAEALLTFAKEENQHGRERLPINRLA